MPALKELDDGKLRSMSEHAVESTHGRRDVGLKGPALGVNVWIAHSVGVDQGSAGTRLARRGGA